MKQSLKRYLSIALASFALSLGTAQAAEEPFKVGFIYVGPVGDHGWSYQHDQGRKALEEKFGDKVETTFIENVAEGADAGRAIVNLAKKGNNAVFATSFGFLNPTLKAAKKFPKVTFEHATGYKQAKNMATYIAKTYEGRYLAGYLAAKATKSNTIGYIASFPIPEVIRDINAVQLALNKYNPEAKLKIIWVSTWFDPGKEADAANALIDQGADVIFQHTDSPAAMQAAERRGVYAVGQASDMSSFGPKAHLVSVVQNWGPYYIERVQAMMDGTWESGDTWGGVAKDMVQLVKPSKDLPEDVMTEFNDLVTQMKEGKLAPFTGPIKDQAGELKVEEGKAMSIKELAGMNWYVEGVNGELPK